MPAKHKALSVYPDPRARAIVGGNSPACNRAIECWAQVLDRSMPALEPAEWNFLADVLNGTPLLDAANFWNASCLALEAHDAHRLNRTGDKWFGEELRPGSGDKAAAALVKKLQALSWEQIQYVLTAVSFFWDRDQADRQISRRGPWWTLPFRVERIAAEDAPFPGFSFID